jgi:hypothetical protein
MSKRNPIKNLGKYAKKGNNPWNKGLHRYLGGKRFKKGNIPWFVKQHKPNPATTPEGKRKIGLAGIGRLNPYRGKSVTWNTGITWFKKGFTPWNKGLPSKKQPRWKGGVSVIQEGIRKSKEYKLWRKAVIERDSYRCIWCGSIENLQVDHIKPFALFPELRFAIDNGRTLCANCHKTTDTYSLRVRRENE